MAGTGICFLAFRERRVMQFQGRKLPALGSTGAEGMKGDRGHV